MKLQEQFKTELSKSTHLGRHILAEFFDCDSNVLNNVELIEQLMTDAAIKSKATIIEKNFHMFSPYGVSGVIIISESHLTIHTWPEYGYAAVDLFTCGDTTDPMVAFNYLKEGLHSKNGSYSELKRGIMDPKNQEVIKVPFQVREQV